MTHLVVRAADYGSFGREVPTERPKNIRRLVWTRSSLSSPIDLQPQPSGRQNLFPLIRSISPNSYELQGSSVQIYFLKNMHLQNTQRASMGLYPNTLIIYQARIAKLLKFAFFPPSFYFPSLLEWQLHVVPLVTYLSLFSISHSYSRKSKYTTLISSLISSSRLVRRMIPQNPDSNHLKVPCGSSSILNQDRTRRMLNCPKSPSHHAGYQ
jgi:hypothetical protein